MNNSTNGGLCDKDITTDVLTLHKQMQNIANLGCIESASPAGQQAFQQLQQSELKNSRSVYDLMNQRGWYKPEPAQGTTTMQNQSGSQGQSRAFATPPRQPML